MISVRFQGKPFNITVIQVCAPTSNAEDTEVELFYEDLQDLLELTHQKDVLFIIGDWSASFHTQRPNFPVTPGVSLLPTFPFPVLYNEKDIFLGC